MLPLTMRLFILALTFFLLTFFLVGCKPSGPTSTKITSATYATVAERTKVLNEYVTFRRSYETLDFDIMYQNNGGGTIPGPSDWDIRLVATVPGSELQAWVPTGVTASSAPDITWLQSVPTTLDLSGVSEWFIDGSRVVGIDRARRIVVYRLSSTPG